MSAAGEIEPTRMDELLAGASPRDDDERRMVAMVAELRTGVPTASDDLRARVAALVREPPVERRRWTDGVRSWLDGRGRPSRRRLLTVGAPVAAALVAAAIFVPSALRDGGDAGYMSAEPIGAIAAPEAEDGNAARGASDMAPAPGVSEPAGTALPSGATPPTADPDRRQVVEAWTRVRVADVGALSDASTSAMATVRSLGGHTVSSDYDVPNGERGENRLVFRVPVDRVDRAVEAFGKLGTVTGQDATITDVTERIEARADAVTAQRRRVTGLRAQLAEDPADAALQSRLAQAERRLASLEAQRDALADRADMAVVRLELTTVAPADPPQERGEIVAALADSWDRLAGITAWTLGALLLLAPFTALAALAMWIAWRARRSSERRLLRM